MRYTKRQLFEMWQCEAQQCQEVMDEMDRRDDPDEVSYWYLRGRRDGYEGAAYDIGTDCDCPARRNPEAPCLCEEGRWSGDATLDFGASVAPAGSADFDV